MHSERTEGTRGKRLCRPSSLAFSGDMGYCTLVVGRNGLEGNEGMKG